MGSQLCLTDPAALVIADTSAVINLLATGCAEAILRLLPNRLRVVNTVVAEVDEGRRRGRHDAGLLNSLVATELVEIVRLSQSGEEWFEKLVIGHATETLDDGEAATISYALEHKGLALIDERKANRICAERFPSLNTAFTVDLLAHPRLEERLGRQALANAVFNALQEARMRVSLQRVQWVVDLIGRERVAQCKSLPNSVRIATQRNMV
jgi:predicted nucleic acid-binding protein